MDNFTELKPKYEELKNKYQDVGGILKGVFEDNLGIQNIGYARVAYRVKSWESFYKKVKRKNYKNPLVEIEDICGFRIILRNHSELDRIVNLLENEFDVKESEDKNDDMHPDKFGYRSHHLIVTIRKEWTMAPQYRNVGDLKFEIQIRTELMDAWANISHQIFYKETERPNTLQRRLYRLSALMEIGDMEISQLIKEHSDNQDLSIKTKKLQSVLDKYLHERKRTPDKPLSQLAREMDIYNFSVETLIKYLMTVKDKLFEIETEAFSQAAQLPNVESRWWQIGVVRGFMFLTIDEYWENKGREYGVHFVQVIDSHRNKFKKLINGN